MSLKRPALLLVYGQNPLRYFKASRGIIHIAVTIYVRFPLSLRNVKDLLHERGITDRLRSYGAAMKEIGNVALSEWRQLLAG